MTIRVNALPVTQEQVDILLLAALANYREDIGLGVEQRSLDPQQFAQLHDTLVAMAQIDPEPDRNDWYLGGFDDYRDWLDHPPVYEGE